MRLLLCIYFFKDYVAYDRPDLAALFVEKINLIKIPCFEYLQTFGKIVLFEVKYLVLNAIILPQYLW